MKGLRAAHAAAQVEVDGLPVPRRYWALAAILLALCMSVLDSSIANVALPSIARDLHATDEASIWVINAYQLAILISLLPLAALGEVVGYRRISQGGIIVFTLASLACTFATSLPTLSLARVLQGFGAAGIMSVNAALVRFTYPQAMLGRAIGISAFAVGVSAALGPTVASAVLAVGHWRWLFGINVPIGIVATVMAYYVLPFTDRQPRKPNLAGVLLYAGTFGLLITGLQTLAHLGFTATAIGQIAVACALGVALARHEIGRAAPLIPFDLLRGRSFALTVATSVCSFISQTAALVALPFEIQRLGRSPVETGLLMTPWPLAVALAAPIAGRLADRHSAGILCGIGLLMMSSGMALIALFPADGSAADLLWRMALCGLGFGFFQSPNNRAMMSSAPRARSGAAGGMLSTARLFGQSLGAEGVALLFRAYPGKGANLSLWLGSTLALIAACVSVTRVYGADRPVSVSVTPPGEASSP
ncbi:MAG: MFS transporter [Gammaproteobacteria bacterium]